MVGALVVAEGDKGCDQQPERALIDRGTGIIAWQKLCACVCARVCTCVHVCARVCVFRGEATSEATSACGLHEMGNKWDPSFRKGQGPALCS